MAVFVGLSHVVVAHWGKDVAKSILVADSDPSNRALICRLVKIFGYSNVLEATDGMEAMHAILGNSPDVVIADVALPEMDGFLLCEILHNVARFRDISVALMAQVIDNDVMQHGLSVGAYGFLEKPATPESVKNILGGGVTPAVISNLGIDAVQEEILQQVSEAAKYTFSLLFAQQAKVLGIDPISREALPGIQDVFGVYTASGEHAFHIGLASSDAFSKRLCEALHIVEPLKKGGPMAVERMLQMLLKQVIEQLKNKYAFTFTTPDVHAGVPVTFPDSASRIFKIHLAVAMHGALLRKQFNLPVFVAF